MDRILILTVTTVALLAAGGLFSTANADEPSRLYLQQVGTHTAIVKWRGDEDQVCWATKISHLNKKENWPHCASASSV